MRLALLIVMLLMTSCFSDKNKWPYRMTPFFGECEYEGKTYTDEAYYKKERLGGCKYSEMKFFDRGEPTLINE